MRVSDTLRKGSALPKGRVPFFSCCEFVVAGFQGAGAVRVARFQGLVGLAIALAGVIGFLWSLSAQAAPPGVAPSVPSVVASLDRSSSPAPPAAAATATAASASFEGTDLIDRRAWADVDGDGVPDIVEDALCGLATCANPWDDVDEDGIADWVEFLACGDATCADSRVDSDNDKIPDFVGSSPFWWGVWVSAR